MIKMLTACTREVDLADGALEEILRQLNLKDRQLRNSVGIITCTPDFVESGVAGGICASLPFDIVGCTTLGSAACGEYGPDLLTLSVLTSDDVFFSSAITEPLSSSTIKTEIAGIYQRATAGLPAKAVMALSYLPLRGSLTDTALMVKEIDGVCGDIPVFGTVACDNTPNFHSKSGVFYNGDFFPNSVSLLLICGETRPRFFVTNIGDLEAMRQQYGEITESEGSVVKKVNGQIFSDYFEGIGLPLSEVTHTALPVPFMLNYNDGTKSAARTLHDLTSEGHGIFACETPAGSMISVHRMDSKGVTATAEGILRTLANQKDSSGLLIHSCALRYMLLGLRSDEEMLRVIDLLAGGAPYHFTYSGGEICPVSNEAGALVNRSHNFSFIACAF